MARFETIPYIYAGDLPFEVVDEILAWNAEAPLHESSGVLRFDSRALDSVPLFRAWMIEIGAWSAVPDKALRVAVEGT